MPVMGKAMTVTSSLHIRPMREADIPLIARAFADMNKTVEQYELYWLENLRGLRVTLVALLNDTIVGCTNVIWQSEYEPFRRMGIPEINDMNTVTTLRGKGIGTRMIRVAEELILRAGREVAGIGAGVTPDYAAARRLYSRLGYIPDGTGVHQDPWGGCVYSTRALRNGSRFHDQSDD